MQPNGRPNQVAPVKGMPQVHSLHESTLAVPNERAQKWTRDQSGDDGDDVEIREDVAAVRHSDQSVEPQTVALSKLASAVERKKRERNEDVTGDKLSAIALGKRVRSQDGLCLEKIEDIKPLRKASRRSRLQ